MSLLLAITLPAQAQGLFSSEYMLCVDQQVWQTVPAAQAVDVPVDVQPGVVFGTGSCASDKVFTISLFSRVEGVEALVAQLEHVSPGDTPVPWGPLPLEGELQPYTDYVLRVEADDGFGGLVEVGFETGEGRVQSHDGAPSLDDLEQVWWRRRGLTRLLRAEITPASPPDAYGVVLLQDVDAPERVYSAQVAGEEMIFVQAMLSPEARAEPICAEAVQLDGRGEVAGVSEVVCAEARRSGCSTSGSSGSLALALGAILGLLRRRRRSG